MVAQPPGLIIKRNIFLRNTINNNRLQKGTKACMDKNMKIRGYQPRDKKAVIQLWRDCGLVAPQNDPVKDIERKLKVNPEWFLVGELDGRIIASCMAGYEGHRGWINYLAVSPDHQREGLAGQIMEQAEDLLRTAGCPKINLQIRSSNSQVIEFYRSIGFSIDDAISMGKRLDPDCH
jgi:ribosomal protein S18 acetylase RimI-like enzyme